MNIKPFSVGVLAFIDISNSRCHVDFQSCQIKPCNKPPGDVDDDEDDFDKNDDDCEDDDNFDKYHDDDSALLIVLCCTPNFLLLDCNYFCRNRSQS